MNNVQHGVSAKWGYNHLLSGIALGLQVFENDFIACQITKVSLPGSLWLSDVFRG